MDTDTHLILYLEMGHLVDLLDSTRAVNELGELMLVHLHVGQDKSKEGHSLASARGHLQHTVTLLITAIRSAGGKEQSSGTNLCI